MFALCHHIIVQIAALRRGKTLPWNNYCLLGDDIVLTDQQVATEYLALIKAVGGTINLEKSHVSQDTFEFAKRWFRNGQEFTAAPVRSLVVSKKHSFITTALDLIDKR